MPLHTSQTSHKGGFYDAGLWINPLRTRGIGDIPGGGGCPSRVRKGLAVPPGANHRLKSKGLSWERDLYPNDHMRYPAPKGIPGLDCESSLRASSPMTIAPPLTEGNISRVLLTDRNGFEYEHDQMSFVRKCCGY